MWTAIEKLSKISTINLAYHTLIMVLMRDLIITMILGYQDHIFQRLKKRELQLSLLTGAKAVFARYSGINGAGGLQISLPTSL